jgi:hypothetical protein
MVFIRAPLTGPVGAGEIKRQALAFPQTGISGAFVVGKLRQLAGALSGMMDLKSV